MFDLFFLWRKNLIMCLFLYKRVNISKICSYCHSKRMAVCYHLCGVVSSNLLQAFVPFGLMRLVWMLLVKTQIKDQNSFFYCIDTALVRSDFFSFFLDQKGFCSSITVPPWRAHTSTEPTLPLIATKCKEVYAMGGLGWLQAPNGANIWAIMY